MRYKYLVTFGCILGMLIIACSGMSEAEIEAIVKPRLAEERIIISGDFKSSQIQESLTFGSYRQMRQMVSMYAVLISLTHR